MSKTRIKIIKIQDHGKTHELWCDSFLMLRHARHKGDEEVVNNFVLGTLRRYAQMGAIEFTETKIKKPTI